MKIIIIVEIFLILLHVHLCFKISSNKNIINQKSYNEQLTKVKPLSTVNTLTYNNIPRLEPGLRLIKSILPITSQKINITPFSLDILNTYEAFVSNEEETNVPTTQSINLFKLSHDIIIHTQSVIAKSIMNYFKKVISASMIISSCLTSFIRPINTAFVSTNRRSTVAISTIVSAITMQPKLMAHASVFSKYESLSPTKKLATTPLYFVSNSRYYYYYYYIYYY